MEFLLNVSGEKCTWFLNVSTFNSFQGPKTISIQQFNKALWVIPLNMWLMDVWRFYDSGPLHSTSWTQSIMGKSISQSIMGAMTSHSIIGYFTKHYGYYHMTWNMTESLLKLNSYNINVYHRLHSNKWTKILNLYSHIMGDSGNDKIINYIYLYTKQKL